MFRTTPASYTALVTVAQTAAPTADVIAGLPKVLLHDHLDGGLRPETIIDLATRIGYRDLPATDADDLRQWFVDSADSGSLVRYLETFEQTVAVMQTAEGLRRVAREAVEDLAADGVVYAELRYAPEQHLRDGLSLDEVVEAVAHGVREGEQAAAAQGRTITAGTLVTAMRHADRGSEIAELAVRHRDNGVAGFDIAGAEDGFPPTNHQAAFDHLHRENMHVTIHAGEAAGLPSIWEAIQCCGTERLGHGVRLVEDLSLDGRPVTEIEKPYQQWSQEELDRVELGRLATYVRNRRIPLETCPSSNLQTAAAPPEISRHPATLFLRLGFRVTLNTDNRLMSGTSLSREMELMVDQAGWTLADLEQVTLAAARSAFLNYDLRQQIINDLILPGYAAAATG